MKTPNRDLLVLVKDDHLDKDAIEFELEQLNQLLFVFETVDNFCVAHEVFDLNKYKIIYNARTIRQIMNQKELKPFVFISNKKNIYFCFITKISSCDKSISSIIAMVANN